MLKLIAVVALSALGTSGVGYASAGSGHDPEPRVQGWASAKPNGGSPVPAQASGILSSYRIASAAELLGSRAPGRSAI